MSVERGCDNFGGTTRFAAGAERAVVGAIRAEAETYDRVRDLPRLARLAPSEFATDTVECAETILTRLERALRAERKRARSGHWTYDLNRHIALRQAHLAETERLRYLKGAKERNCAAR